VKYEKGAKFHLVWTRALSLVTTVPALNLLNAEHFPSKQARRTSLNEAIPKAYEKKGQAKLVNETTCSSAE